MSCPFESELTAFLDGELPEENRTAVAEHMRQCPSCAATAQLLAHAASCIASLPEAPAPFPALRARVLSSIGQPPALRERLAPLLRPRTWIPAGGLALAAGAAVWMLSTSPASGLDGVDAARLELAMDLEFAEDFEVAGLESLADVELVSTLHLLEALP